jgi:hypothetical protein
MEPRRIVLVMCTGPTKPEASVAGHGPAFTRLQAPRAGACLRACPDAPVWSCVMRRPEQSPSIVPPSNQDVYLVLEDFGDWLGQAWRETDVEDTNLETLLRHLIEGQYSNPVRIVAFNTAEGWSRDVSEEVAQMLRQRCAEQRRDRASSVREFVDRYQNPRVAK